MCPRVCHGAENRLREMEGTLSRDHVTYSKTARSVSFIPPGQLKAISIWVLKTLVS